MILVATLSVMAPDNVPEHLRSRGGLAVMVGGAEDVAPAVARVPRLGSGRPDVFRFTRYPQPPGSDGG